MGFYQRRIVPHLIDLAMRNHRLEIYRGRAIGDARGVVLEIGVGSGVNLPLYRSPVDRVFAIDPAPELLQLADSKAADASIPVTLIRASAEQLPFVDASFDAVVMTWTLCSIPNPVAALREVRRVLNPGGQLAFVEHGLSPESRIARWQQRLTPCWKRIAGDCHLDRKTDDLIRAAGFELTDIETGYITRPKLWTFMYEGRASQRAPNRAS